MNRKVDIKPIIQPIDRITREKEKALGKRHPRIGGEEKRERKGERNKRSGGKHGVRICRIRDSVVPLSQPSYRVHGV